MGGGSASIGDCWRLSRDRLHQSVIDWMRVLSKAEVSKMIWTELWMGGGVIVCKRGHKRRRKLRKEIKKAEMVKYRD